MSSPKNLPPGPRHRLPFATFRDLRRDPLAYLTRLTRTHGDISTFKIFGQRYIIINHPDLAREIFLTQADAFWKGPALQNSKAILGEGLLTAEGDAHKNQRRLMQPAFHAKQVEHYAPDILQCTRDLIARWRHPTANQSAPQDIRPGLMGLTLIIAARTLFGTGISPEKIATVQRCMDDLMNNYSRTVRPWGKLLNRIPLPTTLKLSRARSDLRAVVDSLIQSRNSKAAAAPNSEPNTQLPAPPPPNDLLSALLAATDPTEDRAPKKCPITGKSGTRLSDQQLRDQCITILTAGHETTANALTFTLYLLAQHPAEQQALREEITTVLGQNEPTTDLLDHLPRTRWVLSESMRLFPPAWTLGRQNQREITLGGYTLPKKCTILIPQWTLHRDQRFWPNPDAFTPDRWQSPTHPRFAYIPFSTGPRNCIGESFAWLEMLLVLPLLIQNFDFSLPPNSPALLLTPAITLRPRAAVRLIMKKTAYNL